MLGRRARARMVHDQLGIHKPYNRLIGVEHLDAADPEPADHVDLHDVGPADRAQDTRPLCHPLAGLHPEIRVEMLHALDLVRDGQKRHRAGGSAPKLVCAGAAKDLTEDAPAIAGAARPERTTSMRPVRGA